MSLINLLPEFWEDCPEVVNFENAFDSTMDTLDADVSDLFNQFFIDTATWGLSFWEKMMGLPVATEKGYENRRSIIKMYARGYGTLTEERLKSVIASYTNNDVEILKTADYTFKIKFLSSLGIPPGIEDLKRMIAKLKPAHLLINYEYKYRLWQDFASTKWGDLSSHTWGEIKEMEVI